MKVKLKKLSEKAVIPSYSKAGDAGMDLTAISGKEGDCYVEYGTGLSIEIPEGFMGLVFPRSSISNTIHTLANCVGVIDSIYRGEIKVRMRTDAALLKAIQVAKLNPSNYMYGIGDRVAQLIIMPVPHVDFIVSEELSESDRGEGGFGSSGK